LLINIYHIIFTLTERKAFKSAVMEIAKFCVKSMHQDKEFLKVEGYKRGRNVVDSLLVLLKIVVAQGENEELLTVLTPERLALELQKKGIELDPAKARPASDGSFGSENVSPFGRTACRQVVSST